jgi:hypothetical protein
MSLDTNPKPLQKPPIADVRAAVPQQCPQPQKSRQPPISLKAMACRFRDSNHGLPERGE